MSCSQKDCKYSNDYIPKDLDGAIDFLDCAIDDSTKIDFKNKSEMEAVASFHFGLGLQLRNKWNLWSEQNQLTDYFNSIGIEHPDDMTGIIFRSFHRHLNGRPIDLDSEVERVKEHWTNFEWNSYDSTLDRPAWEIK